MSENKHTAEPWAVKGAAIRTADGIGIDVIATMQVSNQPFWDEDARRIVACVNACAGIPTELLNDSKCWAEAGIETATSLRKQIATLTRQRDLAVEACRKLSEIRYIEEAAVGPLREALAAAKKAISTIKGEVKE